MEAIVSEMPRGEDKLLDFYQKTRKKIQKQLKKWTKKENNYSEASQILVNYLTVFPDLIHLSIRLLFDKKIPTENKGVLIAALAYVVSPIDLIPDTIPIAGWIDDLVVLALALNKYFDTENKDISEAIDKYWAGEKNVFETVKHIIAIADEAAELLSTKMMKLIKSIFPKTSKSKG